jgi:hypothetical protein
VFPSFCLTRLNHRFNSMTCKNPCPSCKCKKSPDTLPIDDNLYVEVDDGTFAPPSQFTKNKETN